MAPALLQPVQTSCLLPAACFTTAAVYAYSGKAEVLGCIYSMGTANRMPKKPFVSAVAKGSLLSDNGYGIFADGFDVVIAESRFSYSLLTGIRVSGVSCLVVNATALTSAAARIERASNPGGEDTAICSGGWFFDALVLTSSLPNAQQTLPVAVAVSEYFEMSVS